MIAEMVMAGRRLLVRKVSESTYRRIREAAEKTNGTARTVLFEPFVLAYPWTPLEAINEVRRRAAREGLGFEALVRQLNPGAIGLSAAGATGGGRTHNVPVLDVQDGEYEAWRVSLARDGRPAAQVLDEMFERSAPFVPADVVEAARRASGGRLAGARRYVPLKGLPPEG